MKAIKYLFIAALTVGYSANALAQDGSKADIDAVKRIISSKPADLDKQMKPYYKANKKNADNLVAFGRAFYEAKDTANAKTYANYALQVKKNNFAPAFILLGDIEVMADNGGNAASYYDQAILADPKDDTAYRKYALIYRKIDPRGAAEKLDQLKAARPDIEVDAIKGHIYYISNKLGDAYDSYSKVPITKLDKSGLIEYSSLCFLTGHHADGLKAVELGVKENPRNATFNRLGMMFNEEMKNYEAAAKYVDRLFNASDSLNPTNAEYYYAGLTYAGLKDYDKALAEYQKALDVKSEKNLIKQEDIIKGMSDLYMEKGDFENAIKYYAEYLSKNEKASFNDHEGHATPLLHLFLKLTQFHDKVLRRLAVVTEVDIKHACVVGIVPQFDAVEKFEVRIDVGGRGRPRTQWQDDDFLGDFFSCFHFEELYARAHGPVGVAIAGGETVGAGLQFEGRWERGHPRIILKVEGAQIAVFELGEGEVRPIDRFGGLLAAIGQL